MALIVDVFKTAENEKFVSYDYIFDTFKDNGTGRTIILKVVGKIKIDKIIEEVHYDLAPGDDKGAFAGRGARALLPYLKKGEYPAKASFQA